MNRILFSALVLSAMSCSTHAQLATNNLSNNPMRTIEVTGKATMDVEPDEIIFSINIQEYWEEEFQEGTKYEDYRTKVEITTIETNVVEELKKQGVDMSQITLQRAGNYWRQQGKDFLINKMLEIKLPSAKEANNLTNVLTTRGIQSMNIKEMKNAKLEDLKLETKANAIKAARDKAKLLVAALGEELGRVVNIIEIDQYVGISPKMYATARSGAMMAEDAGGVDYSNFQKIKISEDVRVIFEIK